MNEKSLFVENLPEYVSKQEIIEYFCGYGDIEKYKFGPKNLLLKFKSKEPVDHLLNKPIYLHNLKLHIEPCTSPNFEVSKSKYKKEKNEARAINDMKDLNFENIKSRIEARNDFDGQLEEFLNCVQLTQSSIKNCYKMTCAALTTLFQSIYPNCQIYRFGSTVTGLGFKNCDLDLYFCPDTTVQGRNSDQRSQAKVFASLKKCMYSKPFLFAEIVPIPMAKTPIIKFKYLPKNVSCDISIKNSLAVHNSQLVRRYLTINDNLRKAMLIIKYWISNYELQGGPKLSKYAFTMLFIFYLQQPPLKFPTILELKQSVDKPEFVGFWQINYCDPVVYVKKSGGSDVTIPQLLRGFFEFYSNFDFDQIICPHDGISYKKEIFVQCNQLPASMNDYKMYLQNSSEVIVFPENKAICLQDPLELNRNLGNNMTHITQQDFQMYCKKAAVICEKHEKSAYKNLLLLILSITVKDLEEKPNVINFLAKRLLRYFKLPNDFKVKTDIVDKEKYVIMDNYFDTILKLIKTYFVEVLKLELLTIDAEQEPEQSDVLSENKNCIYMKCTGSYNIWNAMKGCNKCLDPALSVLEKEVLLSSAIHEELVSKKAEKIKLNFTCKYERRNNPVHASLCFLNENSSEEYSDMIAYLKKELPFVIERILKDMKQKKNSLE